MKPIITFFALILVFTYAKAQAPAIEWQKSLGGSGTDTASTIRGTADGGYVVIGYSNSTDGDITGNHGNADYWLVELDATGAMQWQKSYGGSSSEIPFDVQTTTDGGYIIVGYTQSNYGEVSGNHGVSADYWVVKVDAAGTMQWQKALGGSNYDHASAVEQTADGGT